MIFVSMELSFLVMVFKPIRIHVVSYLFHVICFAAVDSSNAYPGKSPGISTARHNPGGGAIEKFSLAYRAGAIWRPNAQ